MSLITFSLDTFLFITISFFKEGLTESISQLFNSIGPLLVVENGFAHIVYEAAISHKPEEPDSRYPQ